MKLSKEQKIEITSQSLKSIIKDLISLFQELLNEFKGQINVIEVEKEIR